MGITTVTAITAVGFWSGFFDRFLNPNPNEENETIRIQSQDLTLEQKQRFHNACSVSGGDILIDELPENLSEFLESNNLTGLLANEGERIDQTRAPLSPEDLGTLMPYGQTMANACQLQRNMDQVRRNVSELIKAAKAMQAATSEYTGERIPDIALARAISRWADRLENPVDTQGEYFDPHFENSDRILVESSLPQLYKLFHSELTPEQPAPRFNSFDDLVSFVDENHETWEAERHKLNRSSLKILSETDHDTVTAWLKAITPFIGLARSENPDLKKTVVENLPVR